MKTFPAAVIVPVRLLPVVFAATEKLTPPSPIPIPNEVIVIQPALLVACHAQRFSHETARLPDPPLRPRVAVLGAMV